jgi:3-deoxy-D-manno-octulosonic-acid transferase
VLIWAPRHPERAKHIIEKAHDLTVQKRSNDATITQTTQIYLVDTLGELGTVFSSGRVVFLGGSFGPQGGHNPFEPAHFGCFILTGPQVQNHKEGFSALVDLDAARIVPDGAAIADVVISFIQTNGAGFHGENGRDLIASANGVVESTVDALRSHLAV